MTPQPQTPLPCPMCGGRAEVRRYDEQFYCACTAVCTLLRTNEADAIVAWNHRIPDAALTEEVGRLKEALRDLLGFTSNFGPSEDAWEVAAARAALSTPREET